MSSRVALLLGAAGLAVVAIACYDVKAPPVPGAERVPTTIGQIVGSTSGTTYELSSGESVEIRDTAGANVRERLGPDLPYPPDTNGPEGGLLLAGDDAIGRFYAAARSPGSDGCFEIRGPGYLHLDRGRVHLSSGLVLTLAQEFERTNDRPTTEPAWLFEMDDICLNTSGQVTSIHQEAFGA